MALRSPIVSVLGHVDHGKSSLLDAVRGSNIVATEAGRITQAIGASIIPREVIVQRCGTLLKTLKIDLTIPGLLFIDTPGHAAFTSLRKRGGALADIAVVCVDIREGFMPQTIEAIDILRAAKTPFVVAANKIDLIPGYRKRADAVLADIAAQDPAWITAFETRMYDLVGKLHERFGMACERFDRVESFTKEVAIVPTSATTQHGIAELLVVLAGLAQRFLEESLKLDVSGPGKGTVLEVKETTGFGATVDVILYDGTIKRNDTIAIGGIDAPLVTKVRALLEPVPLQEMRDKKAKYRQLSEATAATGLRIAAPDLEKATAGMPLRVVPQGTNAEDMINELQTEVKEALVRTDREGVIIKADTLGGLEALAVLLREKGVGVLKASIGPITKRDIAEANAQADPLTCAILGFNVTGEPSTERVRVITGNVIYELIDNLDAWQSEVRQRQQADDLQSITRPCRIELLANCIFRQSNPCVVGVEVCAGTLRTGIPLMNKRGETLTTVRGLQRNKESVTEAKVGEQIAASLPDVTAGRQVNEHDLLYSAISEEQFRSLKALAKHLTPDEVRCLREIADIMREANPLWGV